MKTWSNGQIIEGKKQVDSLNFSLHYAGPTAWEGIRSYLQHDGTTRIFKLRDHVERLFASAKIMGFEIPFSVDQIEQACIEVVDANGGGDLYLRPIAYGDFDAESIRPQGRKISVDIYAFPAMKLHQKPDGIKVGISHLVRGYPQYQMQAKTAANYAYLTQSEAQAKALGVDDMLFVDNSGHITEATVANILVVHGDVLTTPPNDGSILPGITRHTLAKILQNPRMPLKYRREPIVAEKKITKADLYTADCVMLCGTYAEVILVTEVDGRKLPGSVYYEILKNEYAELTRGSKKP